MSLCLSVVVADDYAAVACVSMRSAAVSRAAALQVHAHGRVLHKIAVFADRRSLGDAAPPKGCPLMGFTEQQ